MFVLPVVVRSITCHSYNCRYKANVIDAYNNESRELDKELAFLPPTYQQFLAVRAKAASRRRQRSATLGRNNVRPHHSVSHPLNFHLTSDRDHSAAYLHFEDGNNEITVEAGGMKVWGEGFWVEHGQAAGVDCGCEEKTEGAGGHDDDNAGLAGRSPSKCDVSLEVATGSTKAGAYDDVGRGGVTDRRFSTRARWVTRRKSCNREECRTTRPLMVRCNTSC